MMYHYFRQIDRKIQNTLNLYQDLGKLSIPFFKYFLIIISFLIITSCLAVISSLTIKNQGSNITHYNFEDNIWINYGLPIILYGIICPVVSTIITIIFKFFLEFQLTNIINKYKYFHKKYGKYPNVITELSIILKYIFYRKESLTIPTSLLFFLIPIDDTLKTILVSLIILFYVLFFMFNYYDNSVECKIIAVEKCNNISETYWRYIISIKYPNEKSRLVKKRFNDFKKLHDRLNILDNLPTSNWLLSPQNISEAEKRAVELNIYMKQIITSNKAMSNSLFYNFFKEEEETFQIETTEEIEIVLEKETFVEQSIIIDNNQKLKNKLSKIVDDNILDIFILYEINYYTVLKKRFYVFSNSYFYKFKLDKYNQIFYLRYKVPVINIFKIEKTKINNTNYLKNLELLIIGYGLNGSCNKLILSSISNDKMYNIEGLFKYFKSKLKNTNCIFKETENYTFNTGFGISENILHNTYLHQVKNVINKNKYLKSLID
jgi:hypothetical protein